MKTEIVEFLYSFKDYEYHEINQFLKDKFPDAPLDIIKRALYKLSEEKKIDVVGQTYSRLGLHTPNIHPDYNVIATLDNWIIRAKITEDEREKLDEELRHKNIYTPANQYNIHGDVIGSAIGSDLSEHAQINPQFQNSSNSNSQSRKKSLIEILSWIIGILAGLIAIWEFILKRYLNFP
jgi:hypothetical protein